MNPLLIWWAVVFVAAVAMTAAYIITVRNMLKKKMSPVELVDVSTSLVMSAAFVIPVALVWSWIKEKKEARHGSRPR